MRDFDDLERLIDRELHRLPSPPAPETLLPRVMAAARLHAPRPERPAAAADVWRLVAALGLALVVVIAAGVVFVEAWPAGGQLGAIVRGAAATTVLMRVLWEALVQPVVTYAIVLVLVLAFAASAFWAAFRYVALEGASQS